MSTANSASVWPYKVVFSLSQLARQGPWYCKDCLAARIDQEMQKVETPRPSSGRGRKGNKSSEGKRLSGRNSDTPKNGMRSSTPRSSYGGRGQGKPPSSSGQRTASMPAFLASHALLACSICREPLE